MDCRENYSGHHQSAKWGSGLLSLQFKASLVVVGVILLVIATGMTLSMRAMNQAVYDRECDLAVGWARTLAGSMANLMSHQDSDSLEGLVASLIDNQDLGYLVLADARGNVLASAQSSPGMLGSALEIQDSIQQIDIETTLRPRMVRVNANADDHLYVDVTVPIRPWGNNTLTAASDEPIEGYLRISVDVTDANFKLQDIAQQLSKTAIVAILLIVPISLLVARRVVSPLNELARTARAIACGSMDARAPVRSRDELGQLSASFNTMADRIAATQLDLLQLNSELEERVQQRTRDLKELATKDPLTGLYNRRHFAEVMSREFAAAERYDSDLTCLMLDLDHFKEINDRYGHATGDETLLMLVKAISGSLRGADVAARFGGDEFIVLLPQTSAESASVLADRILRSFVEQMRKKYPDLPTTVSVGAASLRGTRARSYEALIHEADVAMYNAKQAGRNQVSVATQSSSIFV